MREELLEELSRKTDEEIEILEGNGKVRLNRYMDNAKNIVESKKLMEKGEMITMRRHTRFVHFPRHTHDYAEVVYMCKGKTVHYINGERVELSKGEILFMTQNSVQEILPSGENDVAVNFIILPRFFDRILFMLGKPDSPIKEYILECMKERKTRLSYLHFKVSDEPEIQNLAENLIYELKDSGEKNEYTCYTMGLLFLKLLEKSEKLSDYSGEESLGIKIMKYCENRFVDGSLEELSKILHYDYSALSREVKKTSGKSFTQLLQDIRLEKAKRLLLETGLGIEKISYSVGYENVGYFRKIFREKYGENPLKFRKNGMNLI